MRMTMALVMSMLIVSRCRVAAEANCKKMSDVPFSTAVMALPIAASRYVGLIIVRLLFAKASASFSWRAMAFATASFASAT